jgi:type 1 fimbria pilin
MKMKSIIALFVAMVFTLAVVGLSFAAEAKEVTGEVIKINVTVRDAAKKETTVEVKQAKAIKVGDKVTIKDGKVAKESLPIKTRKITRTP